MSTHRYPRTFMQVVIALGLCTLAFSAIYTPYGQLGAPFLVLCLISVKASSRFVITLPRNSGRISIFAGFILLSILLFGGEAGVLFSAAAAFLLALQHGKDRLRVTFESSLGALSAFLVVWTARFSAGSILEPGSSVFSISFWESVSVSALLMACITTAIIGVGEAYQIRSRVWRRWLEVFSWTALVYGLACIASVAAARSITAIGPGPFVVVSLVAALALFGYTAYQRSQEAPVAQPQRFAMMRETSERFRSAFNHAAIGMALVSPEGRWLQVNKSLCTLLGYSEKELMSTDYLRIIHPSDLSATMSNIKDLLRSRVQSCQMEKRYLNKEDQEVWVLWSASLAHDSLTKSPHLIFQIQDITDRKRAEEQLLHDAFHDALSLLPNRALFMDHLKLAIARTSRRENQIFAVLYLDLDRFKVINDSLGHMIGDQLLIGIARRLENCLRPGDTIARLGGDEFTILLEDMGSWDDAVQVAERIQTEISAPFNLGGREVFTTVSIGIAYSSKEYERAEDILRDADTAMYRAKSLGKARHEIFDKGMHAQAINLLQLETDLRRAADRNEFLVLYQPIMSLETGRLRGFEALVRWQHPERGLISPVDFIPIAEETGLIVQLGEWVLREACRQMQTWRTAFPANPSLFMSVNLSVRQFSQQDLLDRVRQILVETQLNPTSLKLEITESAVMENVGNATALLQNLRSLGVQLSMDDFGTGYSSLSYLHRFPIDTLKIDRSFVTHMTENDENTEIVRTIIGLAKNLGMDVVAEGVESQAQLEMLRQLGCEFGQGFLFSKPLEAEAADNWVANIYTSPVLARLDEAEPISANWIF